MFSRTFCVCIGCLDDAYTASVGMGSVYTLSQRAQPKPGVGDLFDLVGPQWVEHFARGGRGSSVLVTHLIGDFRSL